MGGACTSNMLEDEEIRMSEITRNALGQNNLQTDKSKSQIYGKDRKLNLIVSADEENETPIKTLASEKNSRTLKLLRIAIQNSALLSKLDEEYQETLIKRMTKRIYHKEEVILKIDEIAQNLYIIEEGSLELLINNKRKTLEIGEIYGDEFLIAPVKSKTDIKALGECVLWTLSNHSYISLFKKLESSKSLTVESIQLDRISLFENLTAVQMQKLKEIVTIETVDRNNYVIQKGEKSDKFYIIRLGTVAIYDENERIIELGANTYFGEIGLLLNIYRTTDVIALEYTELYVIENNQFYDILGSIKDTLEDTMKRRLLFSSPILNPLKLEEKEILIRTVVIESFKEGEYVFHEGDIGKSFYIIVSGQVEVIIKKNNKEIVIRKLKNGDYFGEKALYTLDKRSASIKCEERVTLLSIPRDSFIKYLGSYEKLLERNRMEEFMNTIEYFREIHLSPNNQEFIVTNSKSVQYRKGTVICDIDDPPKNGTVTVEYKGMDYQLSKGKHFGEIPIINKERNKQKIIADDDVQCLVINKEIFLIYIHPLMLSLDDLVGDVIIGTGIYGIVKRVNPKIHPNKYFALKVIHKSKVNNEASKKCIINERNILISINHPFILKLLRTYQDQLYIYFLEEYAEAGDLRTLLSSYQDHKFSLDLATFFIANLILALEYLHFNKIIHRDLKPENLMLMTNGYLKLGDFGNAKIIPDRTFTLCGTPEYIAPELWLNKGHGIPADYWSVGILIYEFLTGKTPFEDKGSDSQNGLISKIITGKLIYPASLTDDSIHIIEAFLKEKPNERLGCISKYYNLGSKNKILDIKKHRFFREINFDMLLKQELASPYVPNQDYRSHCLQLYTTLSPDDVTQILINSSQNSEKWVDGF